MNSAGNAFLHHLAIIYPFKPSNFATSQDTANSQAHNQPDDVEDHPHPQLVHHAAMVQPEPPDLQAVDVQRVASQRSIQDIQPPDIIPSPTPCYGTA